MEMETRFRGGRSLPTVAVGPYDNESFHGNGSDSEHKRPYRDNEPLFAAKYSPYVLLILLATVFTWVKFVDNRLPMMLNEADSKNLPSEFIGERAKNDLIKLTSYGPRVCGSPENDITTVKLIMEALTKIQSNKLAVYNMEFEVKHPSGAFHIGFLNDVFTNSYQNIPIIVAKLEPISTHLHSNSSILLNCHFDSVPGSPGASDDMISCVTMLEILRVLSRQPKPLRNTIIFLFNGAEENFLPGSHGFVAGLVDVGSQGHRWKKDIKTVINLEACGVGGREFLFQSGPGNGWLVEAYAKSVKYPFGNSIGEEIFQRGLIPSDTDFRIFRDFLKVPGLDFAFIKNGFLYHTKDDSIQSISENSIQNMGSNVLALTKELGNLDFSEIEFNDKKMMVFSDIFGFFMIHYSETIGFILNVFVAVTTIYLIWNDLDRDTTQVLKDTGVALLAWVAGFIAALAAGFLFDLFNYPMPYYSYPSFAYIMFGIPTVVAQVAVFTYMLKGIEDQCWMSLKTALAILSLALTIFSRLAFVLTINLSFAVVAWLLSRRVFRDSQRRMLLYLLIGELFPLSLSFYYSYTALQVFVPIMGRSGTQNIPNVFIGLYAAFAISIPGFSGIVPIFVFFKKSFFRLSAFFYLLTIAFVIFGIGHLPYKEKTPLRLHIVDVDRNYFGTDLSTVTKTEAGLWFFNLDPNTPKMYPYIKETVPEISQMVTIDNRVCDELYCALPLFFSITKLVRSSQWIPKPSGLPTELKNRVNMEIIQDAYISQSRRRITLSFSGPSHITIVFCPGPQFDISKWSLTDTVPTPRTFFDNRPTYFVKHGRGVNGERFEITIDFERKPDTDKDGPRQPGGPLVDINFSGFFIHGEDMKSERLKEFISRFPPWTTTLGFSAVTNMYTIT